MFAASRNESGKTIPFLISTIPLDAHADGRVYVVWARSYSHNMEDKQGGSTRSERS